jgi:hypothetical protein
VQYQLYSREALKTGEALQLTVTGKPESGSAALRPASNTNLIIGIAALGLTLLLAGVWLYQRNRQLNEEESLVEADEPAAPESAEAIMDAILALDDQYQAGNLPEPAYRQRRAELKAQLEDLLAK